MPLTAVKLKEALLDGPDPGFAIDLVSRHADTGASHILAIAARNRQGQSVGGSRRFVQAGAQAPERYTSQVRRAAYSRSSDNSCRSSIIRRQREIRSDHSCDLWNRAFACGDELMNLGNSF
jgi:hypothetical protein